MERSLEDWSRGLGVIRHRPETVERVEALLMRLEVEGICPRAQALRLFHAADRIASMGLWLTAHMSYARQVRLDGSPLAAEDFKDCPEGHTGGALNIVPAYVGYLLANALSGSTRAWLMGQGHVVAGIDSVNVLLRNLDPEQEARYPLSDAGLSRLCQDFYGYELGHDGRPAAPLGSHVNVHTAGGISEGGYLGFAELQYVHMPLPGQELVTFLSDGAFEEQRGSDWAARWWRAEDTGLVMPIMIANGRRIDQRTTTAMVGGVEWLREHLELNGFHVLDIDGRDPAAFAWAILTMAEELKRAKTAVLNGEQAYPVRLPYAIAETEKGYGFPGAGTNAAHNLPLGGIPAQEPALRELFNEGAARLHVAPTELRAALDCLANHAATQRPLERDHCLRKLEVGEPLLPAVPWQEPGSAASSMACFDQWFLRFMEANPSWRFRVGNPDEMRSNRMNLSLDKLKHRVTSPEAGAAEALLGGVITALNEEAVVSAALANKQGLNLAVSYEAFAVKMLGAMRQEAIFARHLREAGREPAWISVPVIATSHTWENGKNEQSHQDPTLSEAWLGEMSDVAPVLFPFDANSTLACLARLYGSRGRIATAVVAKNVTPVLCDAAAAERAARDGCLVLSQDDDSRVQLLAVGVYQLLAVLRAATRLRERHVACTVVALLEPGRFRQPRDRWEAEYVHDAAAIANCIPVGGRRVFVSHSHAEPLSGVLRPLDTGPGKSLFLGYRNRGGTLDTFALQYANGQCWAHIVEAAGQLLGLAPEKLLTAGEVDALRGRASPRGLE